MRDVGELVRTEGTHPTHRLHEGVGVLLRVARAYLVSVIYLRCSHHLIHSLSEAEDDEGGL